MVRKSEVVGLAIILLFALLAATFYSHMPEQMVCHWDDKGEIGATESRDILLLAGLLTLCGVFTLFAVISRIGKLRPQTKEARFYYGVGLNLMLLFYLAVESAVMLWNVGVRIDFFSVLGVGFGAMIFFVGRVFNHAKPHWFVSLQTPWTKKNEQVWKKTNQFLGKLLCAIGIVGGVAGFFTWYSIASFHVAILAAVLAFFYSRHQYRRIVRQN